ncbi:hypothetical protein SDC9_114366 [bioreactor metagenome]|uniref:Uncharacterized protein n=1 Tax=bioreactor metagenome TaxID=1076179 RepID=A0A645C0E4_9ZZZZ
MVRPHGEGQATDGDGRDDQADIAEDRLTAEDRDDLRGDAEERQCQDVHLRVTEEPEQVLPEQRAAVGGVEDLGAERTVCEQHHQAGGEHREGHQHEDGGHQDGPGEDRHPEHGHARGPQGHDRGDEVDRTEDRGQAEHVEARRPQVTAGTRGVDGVRQRRVREPAEARRALGGEEAEAGGDRAEHVQPVGEGVQPRESDVGGTDLERHQRVGEAGERRRREHQQHDRAVHGEELVVGLVVQVLQTRVRQLRPHEEGEDTTDGEEEQRRHQVHVTEQLVVGRGEPVHDPRPGGHGGLLTGFRRRGDARESCHRQLPSFFWSWGFACRGP